MAAPTLPARPREIRVEPPKGTVTRVHEVVNRALCTIALILSIVALVVLIRLGLQVDGLIGGVGSTIGDLLGSR
jgi:hypothetical protein